MWIVYFILIFVLILITIPVSKADDHPLQVVCYYAGSSQRRHKLTKFHIHDIPTNICTNVIYSFVGLEENGTIKFRNERIDQESLIGLAALKFQNPQLKVSVAMGGWNQGSETFSKVTNNQTLRRNLIADIVRFMKLHNLDGFDLDWEYPCERGGQPSDRESFVELIKGLRREFNENNWILTAAVPHISFHVESYDGERLNEYLDYIHIMAYQFQQLGAGITKQNSPLYHSSRIDLTNRQKLYNADSAIQEWIKVGVSRKKLILGIPGYGRSFTLENSNDNGLGAPTTGLGIAGKYANTPGIFTYLEICENQTAGGWTTIWDDEQKASFTYKDNQWIGYNDLRSIKEKSLYVKNMNLGGMMIWSVDLDDAKNVCGNGYFPILSEIQRIFHPPD